MDASTNPAANPVPLMSSLVRGPSDPTVASGLITDIIPRPVLEYLRNAISAGDRLPNSSPVNPVKRRALIVAPQYWENHPGAQYLPFTINDAFHIHKMLVQHGYDQKNIRILADRFEAGGGSDPTGEHINQSLDWLVEGAQPGDYRFFHFAGHGILLNSTALAGKRAHVVSVQRRNDSRLSEPHDLIQKQIIPINEMAYYNEAMVASYRPAPWFSNVSDEEYSLIRDERLNEVFARLPEGCLLTCVLDCCCSGRLIGNNTKLAGGGFRGRKDPAVAPAPPPRIETQLLRIPTSEEPKAGDFLTPNGNHVVMYGGLPGDERARDHIKALVTTWSACHQLQKAGEVPDTRSGILTRAFTQTVAEFDQMSLNAPPSIGEVFKQVDELVRKDASNLKDEGDLKKEHIQYAQVWTSLGNDEEAEAFKRLKQPFII